MFAVPDGIFRELQGAAQRMQATAQESVPHSVVGADLFFHEMVEEMV